jgi:hypothetical protein
MYRILFGDEAKGLGARAWGASKRNGAPAAGRHSGICSVSQLSRSTADIGLLQDKLRSKGAFVEYTT